MLKITLISGAVVAGIAALSIGVPQWQRYEHRREGEAKYVAAVTHYQHSFNAAMQAHAVAQAKIDADRDAAIKVATATRNAIVAEIRKDYPEVSLPELKR